MPKNLRNLQHLIKASSLLNHVQTMAWVYVRW